MKIKTVGIIGTGTMGLGMAHVFAQAGRNVVAVKATPGSTEKAEATLAGGFSRLVDRGKMEASERDAILDRVTVTTDEGAVADCELVVESIIEDIATKKALFERLEDICTPEALLTATRRPCR